MANEFIVAIELGSSKITGIAGKKNIIDGSISVLAVVQENSTECIRRGVVYNIDKTMVALMNVKSRLEAHLHAKIQQVFVGVGGQSMVGVKNVIVREFPQETIVTQKLVDDLMDANRSTSYPDKDIRDAITLEYNVNSQPQVDPVGIACKKLEGNFLNILWRKSFYKNLKKCFDDAGITICDLVTAPLALADCVVVEAERRAGCVLVDLGATTTTVSVYYRNILRHIVVLPLGSAHITHDIAEELQMEERDAEKMKIKYGSAFTENAEVDNNLSYPVDSDHRVTARRFVEIVEARVADIVENVWYYVPSEYTNHLRGGIILTGGGANMKNIARAFQNHTHIDKVRVADTISQTVDATQPEVTCHDCRLNTALALLFKGDTNCAGESLTSDLFTEDSPQPSPKKDEGEGEKSPGEEKEEKEKGKEDEPVHGPTDTPDDEGEGPSMWSRLRDRMKNFINDIISEEE